MLWYPNTLARLVSAADEIGVKKVHSVIMLTLT